MWFTKESVLETILIAWERYDVRLHDIACLCMERRGAWSFPCTLWRVQEESFSSWCGLLWEIYLRAFSDEVLYLCICI
jgi:hypothetical protein